MYPTDNDILSQDNWGGEGATDWANETAPAVGAPAPAMPAAAAPAAAAPAYQVKDEST